MDERINDIHLRLIKFFKEHENKEVTFEQLSKEFSYEEIIDFSMECHYSPLFKEYIQPMKKSKDFTDTIESRVLDPNIPEHEKRDLLFLVSEEFLLDFINSKGSKINRSYYQYFRTDEYRLKAASLKNVRKNEHLYIDFIKSLDDDRKKLEYLKKVFIGYRETIIQSIKDDKLKEELIPKHIKYADLLIRDLSNEDMRIYYYEKYFRKLDPAGKSRVFATFSEENKIKYLERYWKSFSKKEKMRHLACITNKEILLEKAKEITDDIDLIYLVTHLSSNDNREMAREVAQKISYKNKGLFKKILQRTSVATWAYLDWEKLLRNYSEHQKMHLVTKELSYRQKIYVLVTVNDFTSIEKFVAHDEEIREYDPEYNLLIHKYATHYNLNEKHLITLLKTMGMELLKDLKNENVREIINFEDESFNKVVRLFNPKNYEFDNNTMNDTINILLQRMFKQNYPDIININPRIKFAIQQGDKKQALELIDSIVSEMDISKILKKHNLTSEEFLEVIFKNDSPDSIGMKCLHEITTAYIVHKRNQFIQENIEEYRAKFSNVLYENKSALKYIIENFPTKLIVETYFAKPTRRYYIQNFNESELELLNKPEIIEQIIDFRRNPGNYEKMPDEVKKYMPIFNKIFEKNFEGSLGFKPPQGAAKILYEPGWTEDRSASLDILFMLEPELLKKGILASEEQYKLLTGILEGYKIIGWNDAIKEEFAKYDLMGDSYTLGFLIKYFHVIYNELENKVEKGELKTITLTSLLDLAQCYSMDTTKRSILFGRDNIRLIASNPGPNKASCKQEVRLQKAEELIPKLLARKTVAVPACDRDFELPSGKKININVGNFSNPINLTYGERTGACMRIGGAGGTLFDYCLENEHGFHIRFSNPDDEKFASRVSGFRNGNTVFLNELRFSTDPRYSNDDIRDACTLIAQALIEETKDSPNPIQNVVIAPAYVMEDKPTVSLGVPNVKEGIGKFYSDIGNNNAVIVATSNPDNSLVPVNLSNQGVPKYPTQRDKVRYYEGANAEIQMKRIEILDQMATGKKLEEIEVTEKKDIAFCYSGEDWYVCVDKQGNITEYVMENSNKKEQANREKKQFLKEIKAKLGITTGDSQNTNNNSVGGAKK